MRNGRTKASALRNQRIGFDLIRFSTLCPFAERSVITYGIALPATASLDNQIESLHSQLTAYVDTLKAGEFSDGFAAQIPARYFGSSLETLARGFLDVYVGLRMLDGVTLDKIEEECIDEPGWQLTIAGQRMFTLVFSPIYPETHPRHSPDPESIYILFQPESSFFERLNRDKMNLTTRRKVKRRIRERFAKGGRPYDPKDKVPLLEAPKYIKPIRLGADDVAWWKR